MIPAPLQPLTEYDQWILYRKADKVPIDYRKGYPGDHLVPGAWLSYDAAVLLAGDTYGVGFVFTENDPFFFLDIDTDKHTTTPDWSPSTEALVAMFHGAAVEVSLSGRGLHVIGKGVCPPHGCKYTDAAGTRLDFYTSGHYVALTGTSVTGDAGTDHTAALATLVTQYFPESVGGDLSEEWTTEAVPAWNGPANTEELTKRIRKSKPSAASVFSGRASVVDLLDNNEGPLAVSYPVLGGDGAYDASAADLALAQHLAFWTGKNCEAMEEIMRASDLARPKWERHGYLQKTIMRACGRQPDDRVYTTTPVDRERPALDPEAERVTSWDKAPPWAKGWCYNSTTARFCIPGTPEDCSEKAFNYKFMQHSSEWKPAAFLMETMVIPIISGTAYRPDKPEGVYEEEIGEHGVVYANSYVRKMFPPAAPEDVIKAKNIIETHVHKMCGSSADIVLNYMAFVIQKPGVKIRWMPIIQGVHGCGKSMIGKILVALMDLRNVTSIKPGAIEGSDFSEFLTKSLVIFNELKSNSRKFAEQLKDLVADDSANMNRKNEKQIDVMNFTNFIAFTNHNNCIPIEPTERRYCFIKSPVQKVDQIESDEYFSTVASLFREPAMLAATSEYFLTRDAGINPNRAPQTKETQEAKDASHDVFWIEYIEPAIADPDNGDFTSVRVLNSALLALVCGQEGKSKAQLSKRINHIMREHSFEKGKKFRVVADNAAHAFDIPWTRPTDETPADEVTQ